MTDPQRSIWALVPAAGSGARFGSALPKQYQPLGGCTVLEHSLNLFAQHPAIAGIVLVLAANDSHWPQLEYRCKKPLHVVEGGAQRALSVVAGLQWIEQQDATAWALVHDAARACLSEVLLTRLLVQLAEDAVGGLLAIPAHDTLKQVADGRVRRTLDRSHIWQAQTPQLFPAANLLRSYQHCLEQGLTPTDEAAAMEAAGCQPRIVEGALSNFKITTAEDLLRARYWMEQQA